jgi:serine/threonine protein kinase
LTGIGPSEIGDFSHSLLADASGAPLADEIATMSSDLSLNARYTAPECFDNQANVKSDVFSFGLLLYEIVAGEAGFSLDLPPRVLWPKIMTEQLRPEIPESVFPETRQLIRNCWSEDPDDRPSFREVLARLERIRFRIAPGVRAEKVFQFVKAVRTQERRFSIEIDEWE